MQIRGQVMYKTDLCVWDSRIPRCLWASGVAFGFTCMHVCVGTRKRKSVSRSACACVPGGRAASLSSAVLQCADEAWEDEM